MTMTIDAANWGWPQYVWLSLEGMTLVSIIGMHGKERPNYSGYVGAVNFLIAFLLVSFGGFLA